MEKGQISRAALGRIPSYIDYLHSLPPQTHTVSAAAIAKGLGLGEVQVRKDLGLLCGTGKPRVGYVRDELTQSLQRISSGENGGTVIVGAGRLGRALLDYGGFGRYGLELMAAFDKKVTETELTEGAKPIMPMEALPRFCRENSPKIGIIAVPAQAAQEICDLLYGNGIKTMWCFAPCRLSVPEDARIGYEDLALSLAYLKMTIR